MNKYIKTAGQFLRRQSGKLAIGAALLATTSAASAANEGVTEVVTAITGLGTDLKAVVTAGLVIALIGVGALVALALGKRLMGK